MMIASQGEMEKSMELKKARESIPSPPSPTLGTFGVVGEAFKLIWKNKKLMSALVLLMFIPYTMLTLWNVFLVGSLMRSVYFNEVPLSVGRCNCSTHGNNLIVIRENFRFFVAQESGFLAAFWLTTLLIIVAAIYSSAATYVGTGLTRKKIRETTVPTLNRAAITWFYILLLLVVYVAIGVFAVGVGFSAGTGSAFILAILLILVFMLLYLLLSPIWMMTLVVSIVEQDCFGVAALAEASELIKGRRFQGSVIMLLLVTVSVGLMIAYYVSSTWILAFFVTSLFCPLKIFTFVVYTVFYYECKKAPAAKVAPSGASMAEISPSSDVKTNVDTVVA